MNYYKEKATKITNFINLSNENIIFKSNKEFYHSFFENEINCSFCCDICKEGYIKSLKTNVKNIWTENNLFKICDLELLFDNEYETIELKYYYKSYSRNVIDLVYKYFKAFNDNIINDKISYEKDRFETYQIGYLTSAFCFFENIDKINSVNLCGKCYTWFNIINNLNDEFTKTDPLTYFWNNYIEDLKNIGDFYNNDCYAEKYN